MKKGFEIEGAKITFSAIFLIFQMETPSLRLEMYWNLLWQSYSAVFGGTILTFLDLKTIAHKVNRLITVIHTLINASLKILKYWYMTKTKLWEHKPTMFGTKFRSNSFKTAFRRSKTIREEKLPRMARVDGSGAVKLPSRRKTSRFSKINMTSWHLAWLTVFWYWPKSIFTKFKCQVHQECEINTIFHDTLVRSISDNSNKSVSKSLGQFDFICHSKWYVLI